MDTPKNEPDHIETEPLFYASSDTEKEEDDRDRDIVDSATTTKKGLTTQAVKELPDNVDRDAYKHLMQSFQAVEKLKDKDLRNIDAILTAASKNDVKAISDIMIGYQNNPDHFRHCVQLGLTLEGNRRKDGPVHVLYIDETNTIGVPLKIGDEHSRRYFRTDGSHTTDLWLPTK